MQDAGVVFAAEFGTGQVFWSLLWLTFWVIWIWLLFIVFRAIFRSADPGWAKALWILFVIVLPYFGVFVYLIARGPRVIDPGPPGPWLGGPPLALA